jgi:hypothetical protein
MPETLTSPIPELVFSHTVNAENAPFAECRLLFRSRGPKKDRTSLLEQAEAGMHVYLLSRVNNYIFGRGLEIDCMFVALTVASVGMDQALRTERDPGVS